MVKFCTALHGAGIRRWLAELDVGEQLREHGLDLAFAEAEVAQSSKDFGVRVDDRRHDGVAVGVASACRKVGAIGFALDDELAAMGGTMMR